MYCLAGRSSQRLHGCFVLVPDSIVQDVLSFLFCTVGILPLVVPSLAFPVVSHPCHVFHLPWDCLSSVPGVGWRTNNSSRREHLFCQGIIPWCSPRFIPPRSFQVSSRMVLLLWMEPIHPLTLGRGRDIGSHGGRVSTRIHVVRWEGSHPSQPIRGRTTLAEDPLPPQKERGRPSDLSTQTIPHADWSVRSGRRDTSPFPPSDLFPVRACSHVVDFDRLPRPLVEISISLGISVGWGDPLRCGS